MPRQLWSQIKGWPVFLMVVLVVALGGVVYAAWFMGSPAVQIAEVVGTTVMGDVTHVLDPAAQTEPDPDDDEQDPQGDAEDDTPDQDGPAPAPGPEDPCSDVGSGSAGPGMHANIPTGNVWTSVPILKTYGAGRANLELTLNYDSLRGDEDRGLGYGWTHSYGGWAYAVAASGNQPRKIVVVDGDGRRNAYRYSSVLGEFLNPPGKRKWGDLLCLVPFSDCTSPEPTFEVSGRDGRRGSFVDGRLVTIQRALGRKQSLTYDPVSNRLSTVTDSYGRPIAFEYNAAGLLWKVIHPDGKETFFAYDNVAHPRQLTSITHPTGETISFEYGVVSDAQGDLHRMTRETLGNGTAYTCAYDDTPGAMSRTINAVLPGGAEEPVVSISTTAEFLMRRSEDLSAGTVDVTDGLGRRRTYTRNEWGQLLQRDPPADADPLGGPSIAVYGSEPADEDTFNRLTRTADALGYSRSYEWASNGRLKKLTDEVSNVTEYEYNDANFPTLPTKEIEPSGAVWEYTYNAHGDLTEVKDPIIEAPEDRVISYDYTYHPDDPNLPGRIETLMMTDRNAYTTFWQYDGRGNLVSKTVSVDTTDPDIFVEYEHDGMGRRTLETTHRGDAEGTASVTKFEYDELGRLTKTIGDYDAAGANLNLTATFTYDGHGLIETVTNPRGIVTKYEHDHRNRLIRTTEDFGAGGLNLVTQYAHDGNGNVTSTTDAGGRVTTLEYDARDRVERVVNAEGYESLYGRDAVGNVIRRDHGRAVGTGGERDITIYTHDRLGRVLSVTQAPNSSWGELTTWLSYTADGPGGCGCSGVGSETPHRIVDPAGRVTYREFDPLGRVTKLTRKVGGTGETPDPPEAVDDAITEYTFDPEGNLLIVDGAEGEQRVYTYDGADRLITETIKAAPFADLVTTISWDGVGNITNATLPNGHVLNADYDTADRIERTFDADGDLYALAYDANDNILSRTDANGNAWQYEYDRLGRTVKAFDPIVEAPDKFAYFTYDNVHNLLLSTNNNGVRTFRQYDKLNRLIKVTEDQQLTTAPPIKKELDGKAVEDLQAERVLLTESDAEYVIPTAPPPDGTIVSLQKGQKEVSTPTANTATEYIYDGRRMTGLRDHDGNATTYEYDEAGRLIKTTYPDDDGQGAGVVTITHFGAGRHVRRTDQRGIMTDYFYGDLGQLTGRDYTDLANSTYRQEFFTFDRSGRLLSAKRDDNYPQQHDFNWSRSYDQAGRPLTETQTFISNVTAAETDYQSSFAYALDLGAHTFTRTMTTPAGQAGGPQAGRAITYTFDKLSRLVSVAGGSGIGASWTVDQAHRRTNATLGNGVVSSFAYNANDWLTHLDHASPAAPTTSLVDLDYGYDAVGNRLFTRNNVQPDRSERYGYDNRDRLTVMERGVLNAGGNAITTPLVHPRLASDQQWSDLDRRGNWLEYRHATGGTSVKQTRVVNGVNEYLSITDDFLSITRPYAQTHDAAGNMTVNPKAITVGDNCLTVGGDPPCGEGQKYTYDEENRVTSIRRLSDDELLAEYEYDALGRRVHTIEHIDAETGVALATPKKTRHIFAGIETIEEYEVTEDEYGIETPPAVLLREFLWGNAANFPEPVAMIDHTDAGEVAGNPTGPGEVFHHLRDILGSVVALTNSAGTTVERYTYDPYGQTLIEHWDATANGGAGAWLETNASPHANPWSWTAQRYDPAVHLYAFFARTYSPALGRWLHRDPLGYVDGVSLYHYVAGNPLFWVDPLGAKPNKDQCTTDTWLKNFIEECEKEGLSKRECLEKLRDAVGDLKSPRYVWTDEYGWIDLKHFAQAALYAEILGSSITKVLGFLLEVKQWTEEALSLRERYRSGFSPEDLPSNDAGAQFGDDHISDDKTLAEDIEDFLDDAGYRPPGDPETGFSDLPKKDVGGKGSSAGGSTSTSTPPHKETPAPSLPPLYQCFIAGTPVSTPNGLIAVESLNVGSVVWAYDEARGENVKRSISATHHGETRALVVLHVDETVIRCTREHPFFTTNRGWVLAGELTRGDLLYDIRGNKHAILGLDIVLRNEPVVVYTLSVHDTPTFFVSGLEILVHNKPM